MGYPKWNFPIFQKFSKYSSQIFMLQCKRNFFFYRCGTVTAVLFHGIFQRLKTLFCIMEILYGFMQSLCRIISQHFLKFSKCNSTFVKILRFFHQIIAYRICNKNIGSPALSVLICQICFSLFCGNQIQNFPFQISTLLNDLLFQMSGDSCDIFHKLFRFLKDLPVDLLEDHLDGAHFSDPVSQHVGSIDMPASAGGAGNQFPGKCKLIRDFFYLFFLYLCHLTFSFPDSSKKHTVRKQICFILFCCDYFFPFKILVVSGAIISLSDP